MSKIKVNQERCPQDHQCPLLGICPVEAISQNGDSAPRIDNEKCIQWGQCVATCPYRVMEIEQ